MNSDNRDIGRLIRKFIEGTISPQEQKTLDQWREAHTTKESAFRRMTSINFLLVAGNKYIKSDSDKEKEWKQIRDRTSGKRKKKFQIQRVAAAVAILLIGVTMAVMLRNNQLINRGDLDAGIMPYKGVPVLIMPDGREFELAGDELAEQIELQKLLVAEESPVREDGAEENKQKRVIEYHTLRIPKGAGHILVLPDSTIIHINSDSQITFPTHFAENERRIYLNRGEIYLQVAHRALSPFIVDLGVMSVEVCGTKFAIRAYEDENNIQTTLESGSVIVRAGEHPVKLSPATCANYNKKTGVVTTAYVDMNYALAWTRERVAFDNRPLKEIMHELARLYSFEAYYDGSNVENVPFSLNIKKGAEFSDILKLIEGTKRVKFRIDNKTVFVQKSNADDALSN